MLALCFFSRHPAEDHTMLQKLFHVNVCVRDMERSIRFYQDLGFNKVNDL